ncbi:MAG: hypothetical protein HKP14_00530 [Bacteroidia bacterium]|nr:hypothetical protein [Bacteroidia bacterium]
MQKYYLLLSVLILGCSQDKEQHSNKTSSQKDDSTLVEFDTIATQNIESSDKDSFFISHVLDSLNQDYLIEMGDGSLRISEVQGGWDSGYITYYLDNALKIYTFFGEGCGAYCSPMYFTVLDYQNKQLRFFTEPVADVIQIDSNHILLNTRGMQRLRGIEYCMFENAYVLYLSDSIKIKNIATSQLSYFVENSTGKFAVYDKENEPIPLNRYIDSSEQYLYTTTFDYEEGSLGEDSIHCSKTDVKYRWENDNFEKIETTFTKEIRYFKP